MFKTLESFFRALGIHNFGWAIKVGLAQKVF